MPRFKEGPDPEQYPIPGQIESEKKVQPKEYNKLFDALKELLGKSQGVTEPNNFIGYLSRDIIENIAMSLAQQKQLTRDGLRNIIKSHEPYFTEKRINELAEEIIKRIEVASPLRPFFVEGTTIKVKNTEGGTDSGQTFKFIETIENHQIKEVGIAGQTEETNQPNQTQNRNKVDLNEIVPKHSDQIKTNQLPETKNNEKLVYSIINYSDKNMNLDINITEQDGKKFLNVEYFYNEERSQKQIEFVADQEYTITIPVDKKYINKVKKTLDMLKEVIARNMKLLVSSEINKDNKLTVTLRPSVDNKTKSNEQEKSTTKQDNKSIQEVQTKQSKELYEPTKTISQKNEEKTTEQKSKSTQEVQAEKGIVEYKIGSEEEWESRKQEIKDKVDAGNTVWIKFTKQDLIWIAYKSFPNEQFKKVKIGDILKITKK